MLDASAWVVYASKERGYNFVKQCLLEPCCLSVVTLAELHSLANRGAIAVEDWRELLTDQGVEIQPFTEQDASRTGTLWKWATGKDRPLGGLADRACVALAERLRVPVVTKEQKWKRVAAAERFQLRVVGDRQP